MHCAGLLALFFSCWPIGLAVGQSAGHSKQSEPPPQSQPAADSTSAIPRPDFSGARLFTVKLIVIGDHVTLVLEGEHKVRLLGVAAPTAAAGREEARRHIERLVKGERVYVAGESGEAVSWAAPPTSGYLFRGPDGLFVNLELVRTGILAAEGGHRYAALFAEWEGQARARKVGVWTGKASSPPAAARGNATTAQKTDSAAGPPAEAEATTVYVTGGGRKYHLAECRFVKENARAIPLAQARQEYEPCSRCHPPQ